MLIPRTGCREGNWLGFWEVEAAGWKELVPHVPGPPQGRTEARRCPSLGPATHTLLHPVLGSCIWIWDQQEEYSSEPWEMLLVDLGGSRVTLVTICVVIIWEVA